MPEGATIDTGAWGYGATQSGRLPERLMPSQVPLDRRTLSELMALTVASARHVRYYDAQNNGEGNWAGFFFSDVSFLLAYIIHTHTDAWEQAHQETVARFWQSQEHTDRYACVREMCEQILQMAREVDDWLEYLRYLGVYQPKSIEEEVTEELRFIVQDRLGAHLRKLRAYDLGASAPDALGYPMDLPFDGFDTLWALDTAAPENIFVGADLADKLESSALKLRQLFQNFLHTVTHIRFHFQQYFDLSLQEKANHPPHTALFITALKLYGHVQHDLNEITARHLAFYYEHILHQFRRAHVPDEVHARLELAQHIPSHILPAGTRFTAGTAQTGQELFYKLTQDTPLSQAAVASLKTVFLSHYTKIAFGSFQLVTGIYAAPIANSADGHGAVFDKTQAAWPLVGEEQHIRRPEARNMTDAPVGWAIASPVLYLPEGQRTVRVQFVFSEASQEIYQKLLRNISRHDKIPEREAFTRVFPSGEYDNISLFLSTRKGWFQVPAGRVDVKPPEPWDFSGFTVEMNLLPGDPAVVGFIPQLFENERYVTNQPVLKFLLNHETEPFLYSFLRDLKLERVEIQVEVDKVRSLNLINTLGRLDSSQPFQFLGPQPAVGDTLLIGNLELFKKPVKSLSLHIDWQNLPVTRELFNEYYAQYGTAINADAFRVKISALSQHRFLPEHEGSSQYPLFDAQETSLKSSHIREIGLYDLHIAHDPDLEEIPPYDNNARLGYFKLELTGPEEAFGHQIYPTLFSEIVTQNARALEHEQRPLPSQPLIPQVRAIYFSYEAGTTIEVSRGGSAESREQLFHIHPFGITSTYVRGRLRDHPDSEYLLPQYDEDAYLYIGLRDLTPPQTLNLGFQLTVGQHKAFSKLGKPQLSWSYLQNNRWEVLDEKNILQDTTAGFTRSGIVQIYIPRTITARNEILPAGLHWLRLAVTGDTEMLSEAIAVEAQVAHLIWEDHPDTRHLARPLPPMQITAPAENLPEIAAVTQPFPSFNGNPEEGLYQYLARVNERLRHKRRALTHWDFERLVLERFHTVFQARCLSHQTHPDVIPENEIIVVVVPGINEAYDSLTPKVNRQTLQEIARYLQAHASPFVKVSVRSPDYEYIRVYARVKCADGYTEGQTLDRLRQDIQAFLSPWLQDADRALPVGGTVSEDALLHFVKGLPYIRFVTGFSLLHIAKDESKEMYVLQDTAQRDQMQGVAVFVARPWSVIIADSDHEISFFKPTEKEKELRPQPARQPIRFQDRVDISDSAEYIKVIRRAPKSPAAAPEAQPERIRYTLNL
ncbi:MAG: hypothetical protein SF053_16035 [Bacteroidia bacterium]|nr:hypothetical protein [Bacteroidia bacterium]